jgi:acyl-CoA synthetase (AMP-forming)/AMP-acid ligase II
LDVSQSHVLEKNRHSEFVMCYCHNKRVTNPHALVDLLLFGERNHPAVADVNGRGLTYGQLREQVESTHDLMAHLRVGPDDTIAYSLPNGPETAALFLALASYCRVAPLNPNYTATEVALSLADLQPRALVALPGAMQAAEAARMQGVALICLETDDAREPGKYRLQVAGSQPDVGPRPEIGADPIALLLHTSGTTARPKLVPLTQRNLCLSAAAISQLLELQPGDRCLSVMPLFHIHGLVAGLLASIAAGATVCCARGFQATSFFGWLESCQATWYTAVPTMHQAILMRASRNADVLSRHKLRAIRSSSSPLFQSVWQQLEEAFGVPVLNAYGMTEAAHQIASVPLQDSWRYRGTVGRSTGPEIAILDSRGVRLRAGETGEVALRGSQIMNGYLSPQGANDQAFVDGWFRTGDEGILDAGGTLTLCGRIKEMINSGGEKVSPYEVEEVLLDHRSVAQAVVFGAPHDLLGEQVVAGVVARDGCCVTQDELLLSLRPRLARYKIPRLVLMLTEIPTGSTSKIQRGKLAGLFGLAPSQQ